ncbi:hypothetical protein [Streptomyces albofaciens]|uniref:hypothetical protein n=1 Tax=Streptomyces albofaciens TaxID=66866 RepID=UPI001AD7C949|nr:hypothetical protein [Streptomyces albofaciens]
MPHYDYVEFPFGEATVRVALAPVGEPAGGAGDADLPGGIGGVTPVGGGDRVRALASDALRAVLSPLGPVLQQVHDAVLATPDPPRELAWPAPATYRAYLRLAALLLEGRTDA